MARCAVWCPLCYSGVRGRGVYRGHFGWRPPRPPVRVDPMVLRRRSGGDGGAGRPEFAWCEDDAFCRDFPSLTEFLREVSWPDGTSRESGTLLLFVHSGALKACLTDRDAQVVAFATSGSLGGLLAALERGLVGDTLDWRPTAASRGRKGRSR